MTVSQLTALVFAYRATVIPEEHQKLIDRGLVENGICTEKGKKVVEALAYIVFDTEF